MPYDLFVAEEAVLTTTAGGIIPTMEADGRQIGCGTRGQLTAQINDVYSARHLAGPDVTPVSG